METVTIRTEEHVAQPMTVQVSGTANSFFAAPIPSVLPSVSAKAPPSRDRWRAILDNWGPLRKEVLERLASFHRSFAEPVKIVGDEIEINEYAMVAEKPYLIEYKGDLLEFIRKADGSIVISEVHIK